MSGTVCMEDTKTFIAYLDAINMNIIMKMTVVWLISLSPEGLVFFIAHCKG